MSIEFIGCTSAGKTTLARSILRAGRRLGIDTQLSEDFVLKQFRLHWVKSEFIRRRLIELLCLPVCLVYWRKHRAFYRFAIRTSLQAPGPWFYKLSIARIALRKIGIHEIVRRRSSEQQVILLDNEGVLQASHTLFVHSSMRPRSVDLAAFVGLAALPDVVVYIRQSPAVLLKRTLARGHNRIPGRSYAAAESFIDQAVDMFEQLQQHPALANRLVVVNGEQKTLVASGRQDDARLALASKIIAASFNE